MSKKIKNNKEHNKEHRDQKKTSRSKRLPILLTLVFAVLLIAGFGYYYSVPPTPNDGQHALTQNPFIGAVRQFSNWGHKKESASTATSTSNTATTTTTQTTQTPTTLSSQTTRQSRNRPPTPTPTTTPTTVVPNAMNYTFGLSVGNNFAYLSDAKRTSYLDDIASLGVGWLRFDVSWNDVQYTNSSTYDWAPIDRIVAQATARHIKLLPILLYTPTWARSPACVGDEYCAPKDPAQFATFAAAAVARYAPQGIHYWEIWNEENMGNYWQPKGNVAGYADLLKAVSPAMRSKDPQVVIITGGLGPAATDGTDIAPLDFLEQLYRAGAKNYFDAVGAHPYTFPTPASFVEDWNAWLQMGTTQKSYRSIMTANGDAGKQIWETEYGAPTGGPRTLATMSNYGTVSDADHVTEDLQAYILSEAIRVHATQSWAGPLFWYSYIDLGTSSQTNENFFGIRRFDGSNKPAYTTLRSLFAK